MSTQTPHKPGDAAHGASGQTTYERYLRVDDLLALQKAPAERLHPDELVFQITHQTFELWWKLTLELLAAATDALRADDFEGAATAIRRAISAQSPATAPRRSATAGPRRESRARATRSTVHSLRRVCAR